MRLRHFHVRMLEMALKMRNKFLKARIYRDRAEELRTIADGLSTNSERNFLITLADDYERLAKVAEAQGRFAQAVEIPH